MLKVRRARSLVLTIEGWGLFGFNFLTRETAALDELDFALLCYSDQWIYTAALSQLLEGFYERNRISAEMLRLIDNGFLVAEGSLAGDLDVGYESKWVWGTSAGYYHFGIKDPYYMTPEEVSIWVENRIVTAPQVPLYMTNEGLAEVVRLPPPRFDREIFSVMRARRSYRGFEPGEDVPISAEQLRDSLFFGLGIVGFIETHVQGQGPLPLKMTPSGGARNPFEAYVYTRNVAGLKRGIYHYSAVDNTLGLITESNLPTIGDVLAGQPWFDNAAALILLVANFERTMWKYPHPTGFRVVLLEAGHIVQNIALAATAHDLAAAPTCAVSDSLAQQLLGLDPITQSVVYTVAIGHKSDTPTQADPPAIIPNLYFERKEEQSFISPGTIRPPSREPAASTLDLRQMSQAEYDEYYGESLQSLADELARAYEMPRDVALALAEKSFRTLLPEGSPDAPDQFLYVIEQGNQKQPIGVLWFGIKRDRQTPEAYVWDVVIRQPYRGQGFGKQVMQALEEKVRGMGLSRISLNVFGHNDVARSMYERLGYKTVSSVLAKNL